MVYARVGLRASSSDFNLLFKQNYPMVCECISHATSTAESAGCPQSSTAPSSSGTGCTSISEPIFKVALRRFAVMKGSFSGLELLSDPPRHRHHLHKQASLSEHVARWLSGASLPTRDSTNPYAGSYQSIGREDTIFSSSRYQSTSSDEEDSRLVDLPSIPFTSSRSTDEADNWALVNINEVEVRPGLSEDYFPNGPETRNTIKYVSSEDSNPAEHLNLKNCVRILFKHLPSLGEIPPHRPDWLRMDHQGRGSYHVVQFISILYGPAQGRYIVKIPKSGARGWAVEDAWNLMTEAQTMILLRTKTKCPVPEVLGYEGFRADSVIGLPYIFMTAIEGVPAWDIWFEWENNKVLHESQLSPKRRQQLIRRRSNFLGSLAYAMASIGVLAFSRSGVLYKSSDDESDDSYRLGNTNAWNYTGPHEASLEVTPSFRQPRDYWQHQYTSLYVAGNTQDPDDARRKTGRAWIMWTILSASPFQGQTNDPEAKNFALRHEDLDLQNILCDPQTGAVTGIIDWDKCRAMPRPIAYASLPLFLIRPWHPDYKIEEGRLSPQEVKDYSEVYANAMRKAIGGFNDDAKYTLKSGIYQAVNSALHGSSLADKNADDILRKVVAESDVLRKIDFDELCLILGEEQMSGRPGNMTNEARKAIMEVMSPVENEE